MKGKRVPKRTVKIWLLCAELSNGSTEWMELKIAKDASPIKAARYAVANKIANEPAFRWWVPYFLNKFIDIVISHIINFTIDSWLTTDISEEAWYVLHLNFLYLFLNLH